MMQIPNALRARITSVHGEVGRHWLAALPDLLNECRNRWSLVLAEPFENLSYNLVIPGRKSDGSEIVLKIGVPCDELLSEASALSLFDGRGSVRLLDHDAARGIFLLERATPGTPLHKLQHDPEATRTAAILMRRLWRMPAKDHNFPSLTEWFRAFRLLRNNFGGATGPFPAAPIARAEETLAELLESPETELILHGDLHHENILYSTERGWLAIDPKGVCGDSGYEVGSFMLNQLPKDSSESTIEKILARRLSIFSEEGGIKRERLARWAFCHAVLSAVWDFEESSEWSGTIHVAEMLERLCDANC